MFTPSPLVWCSHSLFRNSVLFVKRVWVANKEKTYLSLARQLNNNWWFEFQFGKNAIVIIIIVILPSLKTGIYDYIFTVLRICESEKDICVPVILAWPGAIGIHVETFMDFLNIRQTAYYSFYCDENDYYARWYVASNISPFGIN